MKLNLLKTEKSTAIVEVLIPASEVLAETEHTLEHLSLNMSVKGFRKGKAPIAMVKKELKEGVLEQETLEHVLNHAVSDAVRELKLKIIGNPSLQKSDAPKDKDWTFTLAIPLYPDIELKDYQARIKATIEKNKPKDEDAKLKLVFDELVDGSICEIPQSLIDEEVNRSLGRLIAQAETLNLPVVDYLKSINRTPEKLREEYQTTANTSLKLDFLLFAIAKDLKINVGQEEIDEFQKTSEVKEEQKPYLEAILLKRKAVDSLLKLWYYRSNVTSYI